MPEHVLRRLYFLIVKSLPERPVPCYRHRCTFINIISGKIHLLPKYNFNKGMNLFYLHISILEAPLVNPLE